jgi:hypoxanthine phosphoribosyltransferase
MPSSIATTFEWDEPFSAGVATQELLPQLRWLALSSQERFAHPAEFTLAQLLTFYDVRWEYEPTTFAVRWAPDGQPAEFVTPDFYLPDHGVYLELTTMRQRLVTRKNRKFRKLRERYPNVSVKILYLRDFERLQHAFDHDSQGFVARAGAVVLSEADLLTRLSEMAEELCQRWQSRTGVHASRDLLERPLLLGVGEGSTHFLRHLGAMMRVAGVPVDTARIDLTSREGKPAWSRVRVARSPRISPMGRHVVLVQDIVSSGLSATYLSSWLRRHGARSMELCALLDREQARVLEVPVDVKGFAAPDVPLGGFGLRRWDDFSDLSYIAEICLEQC